MSIVTVPNGRYPNMAFSRGHSEPTWKGLPYSICRRYWTLAYLGRLFRHKITGYGTKTTEMYGKIEPSPSIQNWRYTELCHLHV